jgi:hypothetical protein
MLTRLPGPHSLLNIWLLDAIAEGCEEVRFRRVLGRYEMWWVLNGERLDMVLSLHRYVRRFANVLWRLAHWRPGPVRWAGRALRRFGTVTERGAFDIPVGQFMVAASYWAVWRWGRVEEMAIALGDSTALVASGIARMACEMAWFSPLDE